MIARERMLLCKLKDGKERMNVVGLVEKKK